MKNSLKFIAGMLLLALTAVVAFATDNLLTGLLASSVAHVGLEYFTGISLLSGEFAFCTALVGLKRKCNTPTMGGSKRLYLALTEDIASEFLNYNLAKTAGKYAGIIPMVTGKKWVEIEAWYDTTKFDTEMKTGAGYSQSIEFKVIGYDAEIVKLMALLYDTPVNAIVQGMDDQLYYIGQKYIPMMFEAKANVPEKGSARREVTFSAKQEGMQVPIFPLDSTVTFEVTPLAA